MKKRNEIVTLSLVVILLSISFVFINIPMEEPINWSLRVGGFLFGIAIFIFGLYVGSKMEEWKK